MRNGRVVVGWLAGGLLWMAGCGDDGAPQPPPWQEEDGSLPDADAPDGGIGDDGGEPDADLPDPEDGGEISQCEGDMLEFAAASAEGRAFAAALSGNRTELVYLVASGGGTLGSSNAQGLRHVSFDTTGEASDPVDVVNVGVDKYSKTRDPALVASGEGLTLFYTSNQDGPFELYHKNLRSEDPAVRETSNVGRNEIASSAAAIGDDVAVVYSDEAPQPDMPGAIALKRPAQEPKELIAAELGFHASQISLAELEVDGAPSAGLGFVSDLADSAGIYFQGFSPEGEARGELRTLSEQIGSASGVEVARGHQGGGAVVYTETPAGTIHQLRFRSIDARGELSGSARSLTSANQALLDIALAGYSQGYVIAYRRQNMASGGASIHLMFVDPDGNIGGTRLVRSASASGRGMKVMVANDGRLIVVWSDTETVTDPNTQRTETQRRVRAARLLCAL